MKRLIMLVSVLSVLSAGSLFAQDVPKAEVFAGFSVAHVDDMGFKQTPLGFQASVAGNINKVFGVVGDFAALRKDGNKSYQYLGGLQVSHRLEKATAFAHAMYGGTHSEVFGTHYNVFTMGYGGGVDVNATDKIAIRVIQFDWLPTKRASPGTGWTKNATRFAFGVVFKIASK